MADHRRYCATRRAFHFEVSLQKRGMAQNERGRLELMLLQMLPICRSIDTIGDPEGGSYMFSRSGQQSHQDEFEGKSEIRDAVVRGKPVNPALQRLQTRVLKSTDASEVITSYDRMHHRHNRS